jgi:thymidylate synthase ThyX
VDGELMHSAKVLVDSISPDGVRLTTLEVTMPRIVLAEFNTHRMFSRNSASSRAIPVEKMIKRVVEDPYIPSSWGKNQKGMQAGEEVDSTDKWLAQSDWLKARDSAVTHAKSLLGRGIHKQLTNRLLEPFMWHTCIVTATEWDNFFNLRCHPDAHPEIRRTAEKMRVAMKVSEPTDLDYGQWHMPLIHQEDYDWWAKTTQVLDLALQKISVARCARVSYLTHDGKRDHEADLDLHNRLLSSGHMSPFEHVARPIEEEDYGNPRFALTPWRKEGDRFVLDFLGNFRGWVQYRKTILHEDDILGDQTAAHMTPQLLEDR